MGMIVYKLRIKLPVSYRKHILVLMGMARKETEAELIKELIDKELHSYFEPHI